MPIQHHNDLLSVSDTSLKLVVNAAYNLDTEYDPKGKNQKQEMLFLDRGENTEAIRSFSYGDGTWQKDPDSNNVQPGHNSVIKTFEYDLSDIVRNDRSCFFDFLPMSHDGKQIFSKFGGQFYAQFTSQEQ